MPPKKEISPGRRLRLDRRKAGLDQKGLAAVLGCTLDEVSKMENDRLELTTAAKAFSASPPARVPQVALPASPSPGAPEKGGDEPRGVEEEGDGPGPRVKLPDGPGEDSSPRATPPKPGAGLMAASRGEIAELEAALLDFFAGQEFLVPRPQPDGTTIQVAAVIPGIAQVVGMVDEFDGQIIKMYAPGMAKAWAELARVNPTVRKILVGMTFGGAYRGVLAATLPAAMAIAAHHGMLPGLGGGPNRIVEHPPPAPPQHDGTAPIFETQV